jgi:uncharacterized protein
MDGLARVPAAQRVVGIDVARAIALIGVATMNYRGYLLNRFYGGADDTMAERVFDPFRGPLATRFAATFVLVAGVGVTMLTNRSRLGGDREARRADRWRLARRGLLLYAFGGAFDWIWPGTILFYYGAMFVIAAALFTLRIRWLAAIGAAAMAAAGAIQWWALGRADTGWLFSPGRDSPRGLLFATFVNGTHPLLPWLAFLCAGMILGRLLPLTDRTLGALAAAGTALVAVTYLLRHLLADTSPLAGALLATDPYSRSPNYTLCALGSSLAAVSVIIWTAQRTAESGVTQALAATGRTSLSLYVGHALLFNLVVDWLGWVGSAGLTTALALAVGYWVLAVMVAAWWQRWIGMGPLERAYRAFGG